MPCPYCNSADWVRHNGAIRFDEHPRGFWAYFTSECLDCGKEFVTKEWYQTDEYTYECMTEEEYERSE